MWISKELLVKFRRKKEACRRWKQGQVTWQEYRGTLPACRDEVRKAKAQLELNLSRDIRDKKNGFCKCPGDKRKTRGYAGLLLNEAGDPREQGKVWSKEEVPSVEKDEVREYLHNLDIHKSMDADGMHPRVPSELADIAARPLLIISEQSWQLGEVPKDWRKASITPVSRKFRKEDPGNYRPAGLPSILGKVLEQLILGTISRHMKNKKVSRSSQHDFTKGKSCLTNLINSDDEMNGLEDEDRAVDIVYLDFSKVFNTVSHHILLEKL